MSTDKILLLDSGNTRLKWAWLTAAGLEQPGSAAQAGLDLHAHAQSAWAAVATPTRIIVSNVAGDEFSARLSARTQRLWKLEPEFVRAQPRACGVTNAYADPGKLGADRWVALIAAHRHTPGAVCIVDCGTAVTIDTLTADGNHSGGVILPGLRLMQRALFEHTQKIISDDMQQDMHPLTPFARSTREAVHNGTLYALTGAIERATADAEAALGTTVTRIITGGDAARVLPHLATQYRHTPDLVLQGLAVIAGGSS
ncbi:MAG: type III pantothenate kinase [Proteobacteria bacterium]|nr:type III pantothenate kinase [Pseudomonadota bacterium]